MALVLASGILSTILIAPPAALAQQPAPGQKPAAAQKQPATKAAKSPQSAPKAQAKTHTAPAAQAKTHTAPAAQVKTHTAPAAQAKTHTAPAAQAKTHAAPAAQAKTHTAPAAKMPAQKTHVTPHAQVKTNITPRAQVKTKTVFTKARVVRIQNVNAVRFKSIAQSKMVVRHVIVSRTVWQRFRIKHAALRNVTYLTGRVVRKGNGVLVLREPNGDEVPVAMQTVYVNQTEFVPGSTVVVPAQFVNGQFVMLPAFSQVDEQLPLAAPAVAPCAINDRDADDNGYTGYYAPAAACYNNDGDADDGYGYTYGALPASYGVPSAFSSAYVPVVASGFVITSSGSNVVLLTSNFTPMVVNASAAMAAGATNGALTPGRYVTVYGYNVNNALVATSFM
jgi:hypothetical protein